MTAPVRSVDIAVLGAGPAGAEAAIAAREAGLTVAIIDESPRAGGQVWRAPFYRPSESDIRKSPDLAAGERMRARLANSGAETLFGHRLWFAAPSLTLSTVSADGPHWLSARAFVIATGTTECVVPVPGVTLPGVVGLAATTILLKAHGVVPGGRVLVAGVGPLLYAVAAGILESGGRVAAVVDLSRPLEWVAALPALATRPDLLRRGLGWATSLRRAGVALRFGHTVTAIAGETGVTSARIAPVDADWHPVGPGEAIDVSCVAIGHGLTPATETARLVGVPHVYQATRGGFVPRMCADRATALPGVYIAGDCAGISGAAAAELSGRLAGLRAAHDLGALTADRFERLARPVRARLRRAETFGNAISRLMTVRPGLARAIPDETIVCRCEEVTRATIDRAARAGAEDVNQLKSTTRCGMGPCQGRMCAETAGQLVAMARAGSRAEAGQWTARAPLRPLTVSELVGAYEYDDIPKITPLPG